MIPVKTAKVGNSVMCGSSQELTFSEAKFRMIYDEQTCLMLITEKSSQEQVYVPYTNIAWFKPLKNDKPVK